MGSPAVTVNREDGTQSWAETLEWEIVFPKLISDSWRKFAHWLWLDLPSVGVSDQGLFNPSVCDCFLPFFSWPHHATCRSLTREWTQATAVKSWSPNHWTAREFPTVSYLQFSSVTQSFPTVCDPMNWSTPDLPVHHKLPEFTQTHVHQVGDAIQPSHPLLSPSPPAPNPSKHQGLFQWVNSSHQVAKVLEFQLQH